MNLFGFGKKRNLDGILDRCNFQLASREIANFLKLANDLAKSEGKEAIYKTEFVGGWMLFAANPCKDTATQFLNGAPDYKDQILEFFSGCCPNGQFCRRGIRTASNFPLGDYRLEMDMAELKGLTEFNALEYAVYSRDSMQEIIYHANPTEFVGEQWDMTVGAIEGKIYQLAASIAFDARRDTAPMIKNVYERCEFFLGTPTEELRGRQFWDTETGQVIFMYAVIQETNTFSANLYVSNKCNQRYGKS